MKQTGALIFVVEPKHLSKMFKVEGKESDWFSFGSEYYIKCMYLLSKVTYNKSVFNNVGTTPKVHQSTSSINQDQDQQDNKRQRKIFFF